MSIGDLAIQVLSNEIKNDPASMGYSGKDSGEILNLLYKPISYNPKQYTTNPLTKDQVLTLLLAIGLFRTLSNAAATNDYAYGLLTYMQFGSGIIDLNNPVVQAIINGLLSTGLVTQQQVATVQAAAQQEILTTRLQIIGCNEANLQDVERAILMA